MVNKVSEALKPWSLFIIACLCTQGYAHENGCEEYLGAQEASNKQQKQQVLDPLVNKVMASAAKDPETQELVRHIVDFGWDHLQSLSLGSEASHFRNVFQELTKSSQDDFAEHSWILNYIQSSLRRELLLLQGRKKGEAARMLETAPLGDEIIVDGQLRGKILRKKVEGAKDQVFFEDLASGLVWTSILSENLRWEEAKKYCEDFNQKNQNPLKGIRWHLPKIKEIHQAFYPDNPDLEKNRAMEELPLWATFWSSSTQEHPELGDIWKAYVWDAQAGQIREAILHLETGAVVCVGQRSIWSKMSSFFR